jgi:hypothetical protein
MAKDFMVPPGMDIEGRVSYLAEAAQALKAVSDVHQRGSSGQTLFGEDPSLACRAALYIVQRRYIIAARALCDAWVEAGLDANVSDGKRAIAPTGFESAADKDVG